MVSPIGITRAAASGLKALVDPPADNEDAVLASATATITVIDSKATKASQMLAKEALGSAFAELPAAPAKPLSAPATDSADSLKAELKTDLPHLAAAGLKADLKAKPLTAEQLGGDIEAKASKGYRSTPVKRTNVLTAATNGKLTGSRAELLANIPDEPGTYLFFLRAPGKQIWFPIYMGSAGKAAGSKATLRSSFARYLHADGGRYGGTIGDVSERAKFCAIVDAMSRGFSVQCRFHLLPKDASCFKEDSQLLSKCDFALNKRCNGQRHAIEVKTGRAAALMPIAEFPVVHADLAALAETHQPHELPL